MVPIAPPIARRDDHADGRNPTTRAAERPPPVGDQPVDGQRGQRRFDAVGQAPPQAGADGHHAEDQSDAVGTAIPAMTQPHRLIGRTIIATSDAPAGGQNPAAVSE